MAEPSGHVPGPIDPTGPTAVDAADVRRLASGAHDLLALRVAIENCRACPRLVAWREEQALQPPARYRGEPYWARPLPGFGDADARILLVGLAPAAHGGNRTGRVFTGDRSGDFLWSALHAIGLADRASSRRAEDGLTLRGVRVAAVVRCAPPANRPTTDERDRCLPYLAREIALLPNLRVIVALGAFGWDGTLRALAALGAPIPRPRPRFAHAAATRVGRLAIVGSFHPSQQNTFTGRLTPAMLEAVLERAKEVAGEG